VNALDNELLLDIAMGLKPPNAYLKMTAMMQPGYGCNDDDNAMVAASNKRFIFHITYYLY